MALLVGLVLIVMGVVALVAWHAAALAFLQGLLAFSLVFWGALMLFVGYARIKAKATLKAALHDEGEGAANASE